MIRIGASKRDKTTFILVYRTPDRVTEFSPFIARNLLVNFILSLYPKTNPLLILLRRMDELVSRCVRSEEHEGVRSIEKRTKVGQISGSTKDALLRMFFSPTLANWATNQAANFSQFMSQFSDIRRKRNAWDKKTIISIQRG